MDGYAAIWKTFLYVYYEVVFMRGNYHTNLCGIDEAGRGPFAGPMTVAGVVLLNHIKELDDSKKLSEKKREKLFDIIKENSIYHIVFTSA